MDRLLTIGEVAGMTRLSENTLRWLRHTNAGPRAAKLGRRLVFKERDVEEWIEARFSEAGASGNDAA